MIHTGQNQWAGSTGLEEPGRFSVRPYAPADLPAVRELVARDKLPGELPPPHGLPAQRPEGSKTFTLTGLEGGQVRGVMCLAVRRPDDAGLIHWLHAGEDFNAIAALLSFARSHLGPRTLYAFTAPATSADVPGLPGGHRLATVRALTAAGFTPTTSQHYLLHDLTESPPELADPIADVTLLNDFGGWRLTVIGMDDHVLASALLSRPDPESGTATLWHLAVHPMHRRRGLGHRLLTQCLHVAAAAGARRTATHADPGYEPTARLLAAHDFDLIDTLTVYRRHPNCSP